MVQAVSPPVDGDVYSNLLRQLIAFRAPGDDGGDQDWEGVLVELVSPDASSTSTDADYIRVLLSDGLVRMWKGTEVANVRCLHTEPYSIDEVDFKVGRSIFRGGTRRAQQLKGEALVSKGVEVWNEMNRCWRKARVLRDSAEEPVVVTYDDKTEGELHSFDVWRIEGEDTEDGILREKEVTILESVHTKCIVTQVHEKRLIHVYKQLSKGEMPILRFSKTVAWIEEEVEGGGRASTLVQLPLPVDMSKPVDAVMDDEHWLLLTYTHADEEVAMASD